MPPSRLFLDSNILLPNWPEMSVQIENLLTDAATLKVAVEIPDGVLVELHKNWREDAAKSLNAFQSCLEKLQDNDSLRHMPNMTWLESLYGELVKSVLAKWSIRVCPFPGIPIEQLFRQASERELVFGNKGVNFQDAVILHSAIERAKTTGGSNVLVSGDGIFQERKRLCGTYIEHAEVDLNVVRLREIQEVFDTALEESGLITKEMRDRYTRHKALAREAVFSFLPQLTAMVNEMEKQQPLVEKLGDFLGQQPGPRESESKLTNVVEVDVPRFEEEPPANSIVRMSAIVQGTGVVAVRYEGSATTGDRTLRHEVKREVGLTASAEYDGKSYSNLKVHSFTYGTAGQTGNVLHAAVE